MDLPWSVSHSPEVDRIIHLARETAWQGLTSTTTYIKGAERAARKHLSDLEQLEKLLGIMKTLEKGLEDPLRLPVYHRDRRFLFWKRDPVPDTRLLRCGVWTVVYRLDFERRLCKGLFAADSDEALKKLLE